MQTPAAKPPTLIWRTKLPQSTQPSAIPRLRLFVRHDGASDELLHDLVAAAIDGLDAGVEEGSSDGVLQHVPPAAMQLHTLGSHFVLEI